jgi:streptogramin lyase
VIAPDVSLRNLVVTNDGAVWGHDNRLVRIDPATDQISSFPVQGLIHSFGAGDDGALWLITFRDSTRSLVRVDLNGQVLSSTLLAEPGWFGPRLVAARGAMWGVRGTELVRLSAAGVTEAFPLPLSNAYWFVSGGDFLWLANDPMHAGDHSEIVRIGPAGEVLARYPLPVRYIIGATADRAGNLWLNDEFSGRIVRMTPRGETATITEAVWQYTRRSADGGRC